MSNLFRTTIYHSEYKAPINYDHKIMMIGSCFTQSIGNLFAKSQFDILVNPFGITYNPLSIAAGIEKIVSDEMFELTDLQYHNGQYSSFFHHSDFNHVDQEICLNQINASLLDARERIRSIDYLFITIGTNSYYRLLKDSQVVNNCHKFPANQFEKKQASIDEMVEKLCRALNKIQKINPTCKFIFSVSPIRYMQDGAFANSLNKSKLFVAIEKLIHEFADSYYFPAYEIVLDDLRDYRFYADDMLHPNHTAIQYIWDYVHKLLIDQNCVPLMQRIDRVLAMKAHRPRNVSSDAHFKLLANIDLEIEQLQREHPQIKFKF